MANVHREIARKRRHDRVRKKVAGTTERPRLNVYRSLENIYAQVIDDVTGATLVSPIMAASKRWPTAVAKADWSSKENRDGEAREKRQGTREGT